MPYSGAKLGILCESTSSVSCRALFGNEIAEFGIPEPIIFHVLDHVRRFMGRIHALVSRIRIYVTAEIREPMHVEDEITIRTALPCPVADLFERCALPVRAFRTGDQAAPKSGLMAHAEFLLRERFYPSCFSASVRDWVNAMAHLTSISSMHLDRGG